MPSHRIPPFMTDDNFSSQPATPTQCARSMRWPCAGNSLESLQEKVNGPVLRFFSTLSLSVAMTTISSASHCVCDLASKRSASTIILDTPSQLSFSMLNKIFSVIVPGWRCLRLNCRSLPAIETKRRSPTSRYGRCCAAKLDLVTMALDASIDGRSNPRRVAAQNSKKIALVGSKTFFNSLDTVEQICSRLMALLVLCRRWSIAIVAVLISRLSRPQICGSFRHDGEIAR